jgi:colanic acid/amylovoran biosynthesis glycosyltransferase
MPEASRPAAGHLKDHFLPASETFIYALLDSAERYRPVVLDRHRRQKADVFPFDSHYSPVERFGRAAGLIERAALRSTGRSPFLERVMRKENIRLIHAHFGQLGALFVPVARRHRLPLVTTFYGEDAKDFAFRPDWRGRFEALWSYAARVLVLGPEMAGRLLSAGCPEAKIEIVPLPVDLRRFDNIGRQPPNEDRPLRILSVGRLEPVKGMDTLLKAVAELQGRLSFELWIAGDGPELRRLKEHAPRLGLGGHVKFLGWVTYSEIPSVMAECDVFVLASRTDEQARQTEGTPTVLLEAHAAGLPVVATRHGDIPTVVQDGTSGLLVPESDAAALAAAIQTLASDSALWKKFGNAGRAYVEAQHDSAVVSRRIERIYDAVLAADGQA